MEERAYASTEPEPESGPFDAPLRQRGPRRPWWRNPLVTVGGAAATLAIAVTVGVLIGRSPGATVAAPSATPTSAQPLAPPTDAPSTSECAQAAEVFNSQVGPALKSPSNGANNVFWTTQADALHALAAILVTGADPYSETLAHDASAVEASDRQYDADGSAFGALNTFNTDLQPFLAQCGMHGNS